MDENGIRFQTFDADAEVSVRYRRLPHWHQSRTALFVTFRTIDSLPNQALEYIEKELTEWLRIRQLPIELLSQGCTLRGIENHEKWLALTPRARAEFKRRANYLFEWSVDQCFGSCPLRAPEISKIVAEAIRFFDEQKYDLDRFVVMPNHVHALLQFRSGYDLTVIGQSWMRYTARQINPLIGNKGAFWQPEPFDHIVRSDRQLEQVRAYIEANPKKSKLKSGEYFYWSRS